MMGFDGWWWFGGSASSRPPGIFLRSLRSASPFAGRKGTVGGLAWVMVGIGWGNSWIWG